MRSLLIVRYLSLLFIFSWHFIAFAEDAAGVDWAALINQGGGDKVEFGLMFEGANPFSRNEEKSYKPASTYKLFTSETALSLWGENFRYETVLSWKRANDGMVYELTVVGAGDPSWGLPEIGERLSTRTDAWAQILKSQGVKAVVGEPQLKPKFEAWERGEIPVGWEQGDEDECYGALAHAFNLNLNCATLRVTDLTHGAWKEEGLESAPITISLTRGSQTELVLESNDKNNFFAGITVRGSWKDGTNAQELRVPVRYVSPWLAVLFVKSLKKVGIKILPSAPTPTKGITDHSHSQFSPPLKELIKPFLKNSINLIGDAFLKTMGEKATNGQASSFLEAGLGVLAGHLSALPLPGRVETYDGSGVSHRNSVSPKTMHAFLEYLSHTPYFLSVWDGLPIAGIDGTLEQRMKGTAAEGILRAKTGTLKGAYTIAGFIPSQTGYLPFVIFTDTKPEWKTIARNAEDRVGARLAELNGDKSRRVNGQKPYLFYPEHSGELY